MDTARTLIRPLGRAGRAPAGKQRDAAARASGLSAWLGGVAFCVGFGITAPMWVAGGLTLLSVAISGLALTAPRRGRSAARELGASAPERS